MELEIEKKLKKYILINVMKQPNRILDLNMPLISSGVIDSFNLVDLALFVEDEFGVHIDDSELNSAAFDNVNQLTSIIKSRLK
jgi:acyl carrier protein